MNNAEGSNTYELLKLLCDSQHQLIQQLKQERDAALQRAEVAESHNSAHKKALGEIFTAIDPCADDDQKACYTQKQALDCIKAGVDALELLRQIREALCIAKEQDAALQRAEVAEAALERSKIAHIRDSTDYSIRIEKLDDLLHQIREALPAERATEIAAWFKFTNAHDYDPYQQYRNTLNDYAALVEENPTGKKLPQEPAGNLA